MATPPDPPQGPARRTRRTGRARSHGGRILGAAVAIGTALGVGTGLNKAATETPATHMCGGTERWNVKVGNDPDAGAVDPNPSGAYSAAALNKILPGPLDAGGRM